MAIKIQSVSLIALSGLLLVLLYAKQANKTIIKDDNNVSPPDLTLENYIVGGGNYGNPILQNIVQSINLQQGPQTPDVILGTPSPCDCGCGSGQQTIVFDKLQENLTNNLTAGFQTYLGNLLDDMPPFLKQYYDNPEGNEAARIAQQGAATIAGSFNEQASDSFGPFAMLMRTGNIAKVGPLARMYALQDEAKGIGFKQAYING